MYGEDDWLEAAYEDRSQLQRDFELERYEYGDLLDDEDDL
ncbi:hypothetical protein BI084_gp40 [Gordonia phage Terapin]|uniref:Uncharacterized protein n=5 Tax=Terapinvirus terapin TaxID=2734283 RepID=A0A345MB79_9CAUD|nr:hypothetical protein BI084_gp40 [Gordonia phage Terapin]AVP43316.1 hypothetical protein PBI_DJOKOVIC_39 [Gordonia phage Djokovic]AXH67750.1 hypothetical protein SEA_BEYONCAGE_39 [Gordonia phage Beyoncage]QOC56184.1 hypothetical protein SEA_SIENNA_39 [Gordonia phage Sienna]QOC56609.1 hypothetical protein SEA_BITESIZE_39 [Gordonia phage BiteSize]QYW00842.1 hypothetical protein SEA_MADI_39 [Gordonia phage Madi]